MEQEGNGSLRATSTQKAGLIREVMQDNSSYKSAYQALQPTGVFDRIGYNFDHALPNGIYERSFRGMAEHGVTVSLASDSLARMVGLAQDEKNLLVSSALLHDSAKRVEVFTNSYRSLLQTREASPIEQSIFVNTMAQLGMPVKDDFLHSIKTMGIQEYSDYYSSHITNPYLGKLFEKTTLTLEEQERGVTISSASTFTSMEHLYSYIMQSYSNMTYDPRISSFIDLTTSLMNRGIVKPVEKPDILVPMLLYCDDISKGSRIVTIDERMDELIKRNEYEWGRETYDGLSYFEVERKVNHATECVLKEITIKKGSVDNSFNPDLFPQVILANLQARASRS